MHIFFLSAGQTTCECSDFSSLSIDVHCFFFWLVSEANLAFHLHISTNIWVVAGATFVPWKFVCIEKNNESGESLLSSVSLSVHAESFVLCGELWELMTGILSSVLWVRKMSNEAVESVALTKCRPHKIKQAVSIRWYPDDEG